MSRFVFTPNGVSNLKNTINQTVSLIDNFYWVARYTTTLLLRSHQTDGESDLFLSESDANELVNSIPRFKPSHAKLQNVVAKVFGYNNFKELKSVSESHSPSEFTQIYFEKKCREELVEIFTELAKAHFEIKSEHELTVVTIVRFGVEAWELNKDLAPFHEGVVELPVREQYRHSDQGVPVINSMTIEAKDRLYSFGNKFVGEMDVHSDETYNGSLLPPLGRYKLEDSMGNLGIYIHLKELKALRRSDSGFGNSAALLGLTGLYNPEQLTGNPSGNTLLSYHHAVSDIWSTATDEETFKIIGDTSYSVGGGVLLRFLNSLNVFHRNRHQMAEWFVKPNDKSSQAKMMTGRKVSSIEFDETNGQYKYVGAKSR